MVIRAVCMLKFPFHYLYLLFLRLIHILTQNKKAKKFLSFLFSMTTMCCTSSVSFFRSCRGTLLLSRQNMIETRWRTRRGSQLLVETMNNAWKLKSKIKRKEESFQMNRNKNGKITTTMISYLNRNVPSSGGELDDYDWVAVLDRYTKTPSIRYGAICNWGGGAPL